MSGVIDVIGRPIGAGDISWGQNSFVYVDVNGVPRRVSQVNAGDMPFESYADAYVQNLVDGSKNLPVGASNLGVVNTSIFSGPIYATGTVSGYVKNYASGLLQFGQSIATADIPSGIPASSIGSGTVSDAEFGFLNGLTSVITGQISLLSDEIAGLGGTKYFQPKSMPRLFFVGSATAGLRAWGSAPARVVMNGFPDIENPDLWLHGGLSNDKFYQVTSDVEFKLPDNLWGATEHSNQWYAVLATCVTATAELGAYILKGMPYLRVKADASQVISTGTNVDASTARDYSFTINEFIGGKIYVLASGKSVAGVRSRGQLRSITANNAAAGASTITYTGADLQLDQGDWVIILPPSLNFRWLGDVYNNASTNITEVDNLIHGRESYLFTALGTSTWFCPFMACWNSGYITGCGGGQGVLGSTVFALGAAGSSVYKNRLTLTQGTVYPIYVGQGGTGIAAAMTGSETLLGTILSLAGGDAGANSNMAGLFGMYGFGGQTLGANVNGRPGILLIERSSDAAF